VNTVFKRSESALPVYTLSGNHDMYSGGMGYYPLLKRLNTADIQQPASCFCLRSGDNRWQFFALNTGLSDYNPFRSKDVVPSL